MNVFIKDNFYKDFLYERDVASEVCINPIQYREKSPWDIVGAQSIYNHNIEPYQFLDECLGKSTYKVLNEKRQFNLCYENPYDLTHVHYDGFDYIMIIYLNMPSQISDKDGTEIVSRKRDGLNYVNEQVRKDLSFDNYDTFEEDDIYKQEQILLNNEYCQKDMWNVDLFIPMRSNRAVLFECRYLHREARNFGSCPRSGRLVEIIYIKTTDQKSGPISKEER